MTSRDATFYRTGFAGVLFAPLRLAFYALALFLALLLASWIVDWIFVFKVWPDGIQTLGRILADDLVRIGQYGGGYFDVPAIATRVANVFYDAIFGITGIHDMASRFATGSALSIPDTFVRNAYLANYNTIQVAMVGTQLFGVRCAGLITFAPVFTLTYAVATSDGLVQRSIRRALGGNESASIYHRAKYLQVAVIVSVSALSLLFPASIDLRGIMLPSLALFALLARLQWAYYKKHL